MSTKILKTLIGLLFLQLLISCGTTSKLIYPEIKLIQIESEEELLYTEANINAPIANTIRKGSILFLNSTINDYLEVYTRNPNHISKGKYKDYRYYLHKAKYKPYPLSYSDKNARIVELPFDFNKNYIRGERSGCYYMNSNDNKQYVNRSYCSSYSKPKITKPTKKKKTYKSKSYSSTCGARTKSGSYCKRKVKGGGRCYQH